MWFFLLASAAFAAIVSAIPCEEARMKCAYREGCGTALQNYMTGCSGMLQGPRYEYCPQVCEHSLIVLVSTEEGKALMECECSDGYCEDQKERTEICKPSVVKTINEVVVPCRIAQWICNADAQCSTAFEYYERNCKAMFHGKKCTPKCHNSINILRRQEKAQKLQMCKCEGNEDYNCRDIQRNMDKLCFHRTHHHHNVSAAKEPTSKMPEVILISSSQSVVASLLTVCLSLLVIWT